MQQKRFVYNMRSEALNSVTADRTDHLMNDVNKDVMAHQFHDQLGTERISHQQIVFRLEQQLADANAVRIV